VGEASALVMLSDSFFDLKAFFKKALPYTPSNNGVSKRKNKAVMEMACCIFHS
jgi:hypothetical protein